MEFNRVSTGIKNLDLILNGGLIAGSQTLIIGEPGAGKTILSGIFAETGTQKGENVVYVCVEEKPEQLRNELKALGINLENVLFVDATPSVESRTWVIKKEKPSDAYRTGIEYEFNPEGLIGFLKPLAERKKIDRLIIDSFSSLLSLFETSSKARQAVTKLLNFFRSLNVTTLITMEKESERSFLALTKHLVDTVIILTEHYGQRSLIVKKIRGSAYLSGIHTFQISDTRGINVFPAFSSYMKLFSTLCEERTKRNKTENREKKRKGFGIDWIDKMMQGGVSPGTSTLISGPTGSGKTFLSTLFLLSGISNGEKGLMISLEDTLSRFIDVMEDRGFDIEQYLNDKLKFEACSPREIDVNYIGFELVQLLEKENYQRVVIDGFGTLEELLDERTLTRFLYSLTNYIATKEITSIFTVEVPGVGVPSKVTRKGVSFYFDNVFLMSNDFSTGTLRRMFSIIKMRKTQFDPTIKLYDIEKKTLKLLGSIAKSEKKTDY